MFKSFGLPFSTEFSTFTMHTRHPQRRTREMTKRMAPISASVIPVFLKMNTPASNRENRDYSFHGQETIS